VAGEAGRGGRGKELREKEKEREREKWKMSGNRREVTSTVARWRRQLFTLT